MEEIILYLRQDETSPEEVICDLFAKLSGVKLIKVSSGGKSISTEYFGEMPFLFYGHRFVPRW